MNNLKEGNFDQYQMDNMSFDVEKRAWRMSIVDGVTINADSINLPEMKFPEQKVIGVPVIVKEFELKTIEVPIIIKEVQILEVQIPIVTVEYRTIEIPVVVKEVEIKVIEKEVYKLSIFVKVCMILQTIAIIGLMLTNVFLKGK